MTATRLIIRLFLVGILLLICAIVYRAWRGTKPEIVLAGAQRSLEADDPEAARLRLQQMVNKFPEHAQARALLAEAMLAEEKKTGEEGKKKDTYFKNPQAFLRLTEAAELAPEDLELQKKVLDIQIRRNQPLQGIKQAERIHKKEKDNTDAIYVKAYRGVANRLGGTEELLKQLKGDEKRKFQVYALEVDFHAKGTDKASKEALQSVLNEASAAAAKLTEADIEKMNRLESDALSRVVRAGTSLAPDATVALQRADQAVGTLMKFDIKNDAVLKDVANISSELMLGLSAKFPPSADTGEQKALRAKLQARLDTLRADSLGKKVATPLVFHQSAMASFAQADHEKAAEILKDGIASAEKNPGARPNDVLELHLLAARNYLVMRKNREAVPHLEKLIADKNYVGWGELLSGAVDAGEGRFEKAYSHFKSAERKLGTVMFVHMGLANTCLALGKWEEALPHLNALHKSFETADVELRAWAEQNDISAANLYFGEFRAYLALKNWDEAQKRLASLAGTPLEARAKAMAIVYLYGNAKPAEATAMLAAARKAAPLDMTLLQIEASAKAQAGQTKEAAELLEAAAAADPDNLQKQMILVRMKLQEKKYDEAIAQLDKINERFPDNAAVQLFKAQALVASGKDDEAIEIAKVLKSKPATAAVASVLIAAIEMKQQDPQAAAAELAEAEKSLPDHGLIKLLQSDVASSQGDYAGSIDSLGKTLDVTPLRAQAHMKLLRSLLLLGAKEGPAAVEAKLQPLVDANPKDTFLLVALADIKFKQGQFDTAMSLLNDAEQFEPGQANIPYIKASIWMQRGRVDRALEESLRGLSIAPNHMLCRVLSAQLSLRQGKHQAAFDHAQAALKQSPGMFQMVLVAAQSLVGLRRNPDAIKVLDDAIQKQPKVNLYYDQMANLQYDAGQKDSALATIRKGRTALPEDLVLAADEVALLCRMDKYAEAEAISAAFCKDQTKPDRLLAVAQAFFREQKYDAARDWGGQALALADDKKNPGSGPAIHLFLGDVSLSEYEVSSKKDKDILAKARDHFAAVLAAIPEHYIAGNNLAWIMATEYKQPKEAAEIIDRVRGKATVEQMPINFIDTVAVVYREADRLEDAQLVLERATAMYQENPLLLYQLAVVQYQRKKYAASRTNLELAIKLGVPDKYKSSATKLLDELRAQTASK